MELDYIETIKIKVRVGDSILFIEEMKENSPEVSTTTTDTTTATTDTDSWSERRVFVSRDNNLALALHFTPNNSEVGIKTKVSNIGVADIYPCADVKNGVGAGFVHDKYVPDNGRRTKTWTTCHFYFTQRQLCASRPVCV